MSTQAVVEREVRLALEPLGEFSLQAAARFWGGFTAANHSGLDAEGHLHMAFPVEGQLVQCGGVRPPGRQPARRGRVWQ
jgi:hypothetical protein